MSGWMLLAGIVLCAIQAIRSVHLLYSALWLGCTSAFLAILLYLLGARELAVIELSVGAGLITVLIVFVLNLTSYTTIDRETTVPQPLALLMVGLIVLLLGWFVFPLPPEKPALITGSLSVTLWQDRSLDILMQIVLIFSGALTVLGLLAESRPAVDEETALEEAIAEPETPIAPEPEEEYA